MMDNTTKLTKLGSQGTEYTYESPHASMLETFPNQFPQRDYWVEYYTGEFTSLCPRTGQPDFATISIDYVPDLLCVETKSLKLYLFAYRQGGMFMETIVNKILEDFVSACSPRQCTVRGAFRARGGIDTHVRAEYHKGGTK